MGLIVVGVDGSEAATAALRWAIEYARPRGDDVRVLCAWEPPASLAMVAGGTGAGSSLETAAHEILNRALSVSGQWGGVQVASDVVEGPPALRLVEASRAASLLVVGSRGIGGFRGLLLGSVSQHVAAHSHCPVVIFHAHEPG